VQPIGLADYLSRRTTNRRRRRELVRTSYERHTDVVRMRYDFSTKTRLWQGIQIKSNLL